MHPILFRFGGTVYSTYGVLVALGYIIGAAWLFKWIPGRYMPLRHWLVCAAWLFSGAILGGKLGFILVEWQAFRADPWATFDWNSGWVFWGGFLTAIAFGVIFHRAYNKLYPDKPIQYLPIADYLGAALPMGHWLGRVGCFMEGCCHGRPTNLPWAVRYTSPAAGVTDGYFNVPLHPVQLYEAAGVLAICLFNLLYVLPRIRAGKLKTGVAFLGYLCEYAALRFVLEWFRGDERGAFLWPVLSPGQWMSLGVLLVCGPWLWRRGVRNTPSAEPAQAAASARAIPES